MLLVISDMNFLLRLGLKVSIKDSADDFVGGGCN